jgi:predicted nucleic acid-binding protein
MEASLHISVVTIGELRRGAALIPISAQRNEPEQWIEEDMAPRFDGRILPVTYAIANRWGVLDARSKLEGIPLDIPDGLIAAIALEHNLTVVTRNTRDFSCTSASLLHPWQGSFQ